MPQLESLLCDDSINKSFHVNVVNLLKVFMRLNDADFKV